MNKTRNQLIQFCLKKQGTPYVFGMKGQVLTEDALLQLAAQYPNVFNKSYINQSRTFINRQCTDCSGLISWCTGIQKNSSEYRNTAVVTKNINELDESMAGWALWKPGHIGIYIGNGKCIEAKGIQYGTVKTDVSKTNWELALMLKDIDYGETALSADHPVRWIKEDGGVRFYLTPDRYVANDWYKDGSQWFWFDGAGHAIRNDWYYYKDNWYYFGEDFAMVTGIQVIHKIIYYFEEDGALAKTNTNLTVQIGADGVIHTNTKTPEYGSPALDAFFKGENGSLPQP